MSRGDGNRPLLVVGWSDSSSVFRRSEVEGEFSEPLSSTKPIPGVRGVCGATGGWLCVGSLRRQERARTPTRRITVPKAIYISFSRCLEKAE